MLFGYPSVCCHLAVLLCLTCFFSVSLVSSLIFPLFSLVLHLSLPPYSVLPPSAELREGWYSNDRVAFLSLSCLLCLPLNCHLRLSLVYLQFSPLRHTVAFIFPLLSLSVLVCLLCVLS